jgi:hypothetical protein
MIGFATNVGIGILLIVTVIVAAIPAVDFLKAS